MNQLSIPGGQFNVKSLKQACFDYAKRNMDSVYDSQSGNTLHKVIAENAVAGVCASNRRHEHTYFASYQVHIQLTAAEHALCILDAAIWGRPEIEGLVLFWKYEIKLCLIEKLSANGRDFISCQLIES